MGGRAIPEATGLLQTVLQASKYVGEVSFFSSWSRLEVRRTSGLYPVMLM